MASLFTHAFVGAALGQAGSRDARQDWRFWCAATACSMLPDIDSIGFHMGIPYGALWGHRGMTHSLLFAAVVAAGVALMFRGAGRNYWKTALLLFVITTSHGVLDAMTNGGLGVAFFSPFNPHRYFFSWRPIPVSPIGVGVFFSAHGMNILSAEFILIWFPVLIFSAAIRLFRGRREQSTEGKITL